jgi:DNA invertase Pin-like site-specific DNA recombinase
MTGDQHTRATQYLRMSTEHQQYSIDNQARSIEQYAKAHGFAITRTYSDSAKSGFPHLPMKSNRCKKSTEC